MPEHVRQGLVENAGGQLMCPHPRCRLPVTMHQAVTATKPYTVHVNHRRVATVAADDGLQSTFAVVIDLTCEGGHESKVAFETEPEGARVESWWEDEDE
jgi:hypothetical protein